MQFGQKFNRRNNMLNTTGKVTVHKCFWCDKGFQASKRNAKRTNTYIDTQNMF